MERFCRDDDASSQRKWTSYISRHTIHPVFCFFMGSRHGAPCEKTDAQREYRQAKDCSRRCENKGYISNFQRYQQQDTCRKSEQAIGWNEDICRHLDQIAHDNSYIATWYERQRHENTLIAQGKNAYTTKREDNFEAVKAVKDLSQKDEQETNGKGRKRGGLLKSERRINFFFGNFLLKEFLFQFSRVLSTVPRQCTMYIHTQLP